MNKIEVNCETGEVIVTELEDDTSLETSEPSIDSATESNALTEASEVVSDPVAEESASAVVQDQEPTAKLSTGDPELSTELSTDSL